MDREAPASLLWCLLGARREARGPVCGLARGERVLGVGETWRALAGSLRKLAMTGARGVPLADTLHRDDGVGLFQYSIDGIYLILI